MPFLQAYLLRRCFTTKITINVLDYYYCDRGRVVCLFAERGGLLEGRGHRVVAVHVLLAHSEFDYLLAV